MLFFIIKTWCLVKHFLSNASSFSLLFTSYIVQNTNSLLNENLWNLQWISVRVTLQINAKISASLCWQKYLLIQLLHLSAVNHPDSLSYILLTQPTYSLSFQESTHILLPTHVNHWQRKLFLTVLKTENKQTKQIPNITSDGNHLLVLPCTAVIKARIWIATFIKIIRFSPL